MIKKYANFLIAFLFPVFLLGQTKKLDCNAVKNGTFYFYPMGSQEKFTIIRSNSLQKEINTTRNDTTFYKMIWQNDCNFDLTFLRRNRQISEEERSFYTAHKVLVYVTAVTKDYYLFKGGLDSMNNTKAIVDTVWFKPR